MDDASHSRPVAETTPGTSPVAQPAAAPQPPAPPAATRAAVPPALTGAAPSARRSGKRKRLVLLAVALGALAAGGWAGERWWTFGRFQVTTDDAYVQADITNLSAKVGGYIAALPVDENQAVKAGDVIARIDDADYRVALDAARGKASTIDATIARIGTQILAQDAAVNEAKAQVNAATAEQVRAEAEYRRATALIGTPAGLPKRVDETRADLDKANAALAAANAGVSAASGQRDVLVAQQLEARRQLSEQQAAVRRAELDLDNTAIRAPVDGVLGNRAVNLGAFVQPGSRIGALVPDNAYYIEANYKETQLGSIRPGLPARVAVDALDGNVLHGSVISIAPGSGATFSLLPPENATGNFTKITQRIPVRIAISPADQHNPVLRPGLSVVVDIDTRGKDGADTPRP